MVTLDCTDQVALEHDLDVYLARIKVRESALYANLVKLNSTRTFLHLQYFLGL